MIVMLKMIFKNFIVYNSCRDILKKYDYVKIRTQRLQGLVLNIFCLRKHITHLRLIEAQYTRTGCGGMWVRKNYNYINSFLNFFLVKKYII